MSNLSLYQAADDVVALLDSFDPETGEYPEGFETALAAFHGKGASVVAYILNRDLEIDAIDGVIKKLSLRKKAIQSRQDRLRTYLQDQMKRSGTTEISANDGTFKARLLIERDASVEIYEEGMVPQDYLREIPATYAPDKTLIKKAIADGFEVPGARILKKDRLEINS